MSGRPLLGSSRSSGKTGEAVSGFFYLAVAITAIGAFMFGVGL